MSWLLLLTAAGCATPLPTCKSPLRPARMSPDSVVLEMFFVRFPFGDPTVNEKLWEQVDEQSFPSELRSRLARNGFRVGVLSGQLPEELSTLMALGDRPLEGGEAESEQVEGIAQQARVVRRHLQLRAGRRGEILASGIYGQLPVLTCDGDRISGETYENAQSVFAVKSLPQPDGRVRLELVPEVQHGQPRQRWVGDRGMLRLDTSRPKKACDDLAMAVDLVPGAMLILSALPNRPGSLGYHFFTESDPKVEQKLLVIRLAQTQHDALFSPPEPLRLEASSQ